MNQNHSADRLADTDTGRGYPMTEGALERLVGEERRLAATTRGAQGGADPDSSPGADRRLAIVRSVVASARVDRTPNRAVIGRSVSVADEGEVDTYRLVIPGASDPASGRISVDSPLGSALLGAKPGDHVEYPAPVGTRAVTVVSLEEDAAPF